jgi:hypothetical protein
MSSVLVTLLSGFWLDGEHHRKVWLQPLAGEHETFLLDLDTTLLPAQRTSELLARCMATQGSAPVEPEALARLLTAGDREALLLRLRRLTFGDRMEAVLSCPLDGCGERIEPYLSVSELLLAPYEDPRPQYERSWDVEDAAYSVVLRLPTGADLEAAAVIARSDAGAGASLLLQHCTLAASRGGVVVEPLALPLNVRSAIADELAALDPQAELTLTTRCPACSGTLTALLDAASFLFHELEGRALHLYHEIHTLALHYHWSEAEILRLGVRKRHRYLELLTGSSASEVLG